MVEIDARCWGCGHYLIEVCRDTLTVKHGDRTYCSLDCAVRHDQQMQADARGLEDRL